MMLVMLDPGNGHGDLEIKSYSVEIEEDGKKFLVRFGCFGIVELATAEEQWRDRCRERVAAPQIKWIVGLGSA